MTNKFNILAGIIVLCASPVFASPTLYIDDASGNLGTVDVTTGTAHVIGSMGVVMTDIAFDPSGNLYGISFTSLYRINAVTGASTFIGNTGLSDGNALVFGADGTLYAAGSNGTDLYSINRATGVASVLGNIGFTSAGDLAFNGGNFYMSSTSGQLIRINLAGGDVGTAVGSLGFANVYGLATGGNGVLYGISGTSVFSVNTTTGAGTLVSDYSGQGLASANGSSFYTEAGATVPDSASTVGLLSCVIVAIFGLARKTSRSSGAVQLTKTIKVKAGARFKI